MTVSFVLTDDQMEACWAHFALVLEANARFNLTRITDPATAAVKHYADSLSLLTWPRTGDEDIGRIIDVGTGAGFPAVPLAIARPDWRVTAVDSIAKKTDFLAEVADKLLLTNFQVVQLRVGQQPPDAPAYDLAVFRAVGKLADCLKAGRDWVRPGGWLVCYKSATLPAPEWAAARRVLQKGLYRQEAQIPVTFRVADELIHHQLICFRRGDARSLS